MQVTPSFLRKIAALAVFVPLVFTLVSQAIIWLIPGCNPNPYAPGQCAGSVTLANALIFGQLGGVYVALLLGLFVSIPLLITAVVLKFLRRRYPKNAA
jgi:hypothetical protein